MSVPYFFKEAYLHYIQHKTEILVYTFQIINLTIETLQKTLTLDPYLNTMNEFI